MDTTKSSQAVSPVVGVILVVAITVTLSGVVGVFVFDLGQSVSDSATQSDIATRTTYNDGGTASIQVVTGDADSLRILVNGTEVANTTNPTPGDTLTVDATADSGLTVISHSDGRTTVVTATNPGTLPPIPETGLLAYWPLDETSGTTVADASGNGFDGTTESSHSTGPTLGSPGVVNTAYAFDLDPNGGMGDYVSLPNENGQYPSGSWTVSAWVYLTDSTAETNAHYVFDLNFAASSDNPRDSGLNLNIVDDGRVRTAFKPENASNLQSVSTPKSTAHSETWTLATITRNATTGEVTVYVNDTPEATDTFETGAMDYDADLYEDDSVNIGAWTRGGWEGTGYDGRIDEVRLYDRALTEQEVTDLYRATK